MFIDVKRNRSYGNRIAKRHTKQIMLLVEKS